MKFRKLIAGAMASALAFTVVPFADYSALALEIDTNGIIDELIMPDEITATETEYTATIDGIEVYYDFLDDGTIEIKSVKSQPETPVDLTIPSKINGTAVTSIGENAFFNIKNIRSLTISEGIKEINKCAFTDCDDIVSISIPSTVIYIDIYAFSAIDNLEHITVSEKNKRFASVDDVLFIYDSDGESFFCIMFYPMKKTDLSTYNIPDGVQYVNAYCFIGNSSLESVHIPNTVKGIHDYSFRSCKSLTEIRFPESVTYISANAFEGIENLKVKILNPECSFYTADIENHPTFDSTAVIYGKEGSTAQTYAQQAGLEFKSMFTYGVDNLNFINSYNDFDLNSNSTHADAFKDKELLSTFKSKISNADYNTIFKDYTMLDGTVKKGKINNTWTGACQGMAAIVILAKNGLVNYSDFTKGATSAYTMGSAKSNEKLRSLMEYYYLLQFTRPMITYSGSQKNDSAINAIRQMLDENNLALIGIEKSDAGHAIVGYDYEEGISKTINGVTYDGCIYIYDPNYSTNYNEECNIYYNTQTYEWVIPNHNDYDCFNSFVADLSLINYKGYIDYPEAGDVDEYYDRIDVKNNSAGKAIGTTSRTKHTLNMSASKNAFGNLPSQYDQYTISFDKADFYDIAVQSTDITLRASSMSSDYAYMNMIEPSITIKNSKPTNYRLSITTNDEPAYENEVFTCEISGSGAVEVTMTKADDGYYIEGDKLSNLSMKAWNQDFNFQGTLNVERGATKIYLYQREDTFYFRTIEKQEPTYILGDVTMDGIINASDATMALRAYTLTSSSLDDELDDIQFMAADVDGDGQITGSDATTILRYYTLLSSLTGDATLPPMEEWLKSS